MATDTTNVTNANGADLHDGDIDHAQLTQSNAAPVVVQVPAGENVVRVQVTPGETIQLPFPIDAVVARLGDNGNLAVKVGDVTVILLGYADATAQADVTLLGTDARPMDVAAVLASTDPNLDIQTAAGPAAGADAAGADNNGGLFAPFDPSAGIDGLNAVGGLDPTALNYNLIQRNFIEIIENDVVPVVDNTPTILKIGHVLINEDDLPPSYSGGESEKGAGKIFYSYEGNDKYDGDDHDEGGLTGPTDGTGNNDDMDKELLKQQVLIDVDFHGEVPGDLKLRTDGLPQNWTSDNVPITWELSPDGHTLTGLAGGMPVIMIEVTNAPSTDGHFVVDVQLLAPLDHPDAGVSPNIQDLLDADIAFDVIDSNGSKAQGTFEAAFEDDVPFDMQVIYSNYDDEQGQYTPNLIDEDDFKSGNGDSAPGDDDVNPNGLQGTARVEGFVSVQFGADGPAATDSFKFGVTDGADTGLKTSTGQQITWHVIDAQHIEGVVAGQQMPAFTVDLGLGFPAGYFLFQLNEALYHPSQDDPSTQEIEIGFEDNLDIYIPVIATDNDGDSIATNIHVILDDDMPRVDTFDTDEGSYLFLTSDETVGGKGDDGSYNPPSDGGTIENDEDYVTEPAALAGKYGDVIGGSSGWLSQVFSYNAGADGEKSHGYGLNVVDANTSLIDTQSQEPITLVQDDAGTVRGVVTINGAEVTVFAVVVDDQTGEITFVQYRAVDHGADMDGEMDISLPDETLPLGSEHLQATFTVTDNDGDTVSRAIDIGDRLVFEDDGPSIIGENASVALDDDLLPDGNEGGEGDNAPNIGDLDVDVDGHPYVTGTLAHEYGSDGAGTTLLAGLTPPAGSWGSSNNGTTLIVFQDGHPVLEVKLDDATSGKYTVTQLAPIMHPDGNEENDLQFIINYRVTDGDGDFVDASFAINIDDDTPVVTAANYDTPVATEGGEPVFLQSLADFMADHVSAGADGYKDGSLTFQAGSLGGTLDIVANPNDGGAMWIRYTPPANVNDPTPPSDETFNFSVSDNDNDLAGSTVTVKVNDGAGPSLAAATGTVDEEGLEMGLPGTSYVDGSDVAGVATSTGGTLNVTLGSDPLAADNPFNLNGTNNLNGLKTTDGTTVLLAAPTSTEVAGKTVLTLVGYEAGGSAANPADQVFVLTLNRDTGEWNFQLLQPVQHPLANTEDDRNISIGVSVSDVDGTTGNGTIAITIDDDSPTMAVNTRPMPPLIVDDTTLDNDATGAFAGIFTGLAGADGQKGDIAYALNVKSPGVDSGVFDVATGNKVYLFLDGGVVIGREGTSALDAQTGDTVFTVSVDTAGTVKLDQVRPVQHDDPLDPQESGGSAVKLAAADLITLTATITDGDDDTASATANIAGQLSFLDDGPSIDDHDNVQLDDDAFAGGNAGGVGDADPDTANSTGVLVHGYGADGAGTTLLTSANLPGAGGFTQLVSPDGKTLTISQNGTPVLKVELSDTSAGSYTVTQLAPISHPAGANENDLSFNVIFRVTDKDGDWVEGSLQIDVDDDTPTVSSNALVQLDDDALAGGIANGTGDDANSVNATGTLAHSYGADGAGTTLLTAATLPVSGGFTQVVSLDGKTVTISQNGTPVLKVELTDTSSGAYTVTQLAAISHPVGSDENNVQFTVNYQVTDKDGDTANGSMVVDVDDDTPTVSSNALVQLDDDALAGGIANGTGDDANSVNATGTLAHNYGADGAGTTLLTAATLPVSGGFTQVVSLDGKTVTISQNGTPVLKIELTDTAAGSYAVTQLAAISHPVGSDENNVQFTVNYQVTDKDGDTANGSMAVDVDDDTPTVSSNALVQLDDDAQTGGNANGTGDDANSVNATGTLAHSYGADGAGTTLLTAATLPVSGGFTQVVSLDGKTVTISQNGTPVLKIELTDTAAGSYAVTQLAAISHPVGSNENNLQFTVNYQVTDKDGDTVAGSMVVDVDDDTPSATNDSGGSVNDGATVTANTVASGVLGNDQFGADGAKSGGGVVGVVAGSGSTQSTTGINAPIVTSLGTLTLQANGTYSYTAKGNVGGTDTFTYTIEDADGDRTTAVLTFNVVDQPRGTIDPIVAWSYEDGQPNQHTGSTTTSFSGLPNASGIDFASAFHPADNEVITQITFTLPAGVKLVFWDGVNAVQQGLTGPSTVTVAAADLAKVQFIAGPNVDADQSVIMAVTIKDNDSNISTVLPDQTLTVKVDAVADKPTAVDITITDNDGNGLFNVNETGVVNIKATFADGDGSETHSLVFKVPAGFNLTDWNGTSWTTVLPAGVTVQSVTGSSGTGWTVTFAVADATSSVDLNVNVKNTAAVAADAQFTVDAKSTEEATTAGPNGNGSGSEFTNTNNAAVTSDAIGVVSARILNGQLVTNTPSAQQGDQAMVLTFVQDGQPLNAYSQVVVRDTQGQQGAVLADSGFNIDPSKDFNVALENPLEGHKIIVTDFNLEGVTLDVSGGNIQIEHEDSSGKPMGVYAQMSPNDGGTVIVTDSIDGTSGNNNPHNGTAGQDYLYGGAGNDTINGGNDDDVLNGGVGNDTLNGDAGNDVLVWNGGLQTDAANPASGDTYHGGSGFDLLRIDQGALFNSSIGGKTSIDFFPDQAADATVDLRGAHADGIEGILLTEEAVITGSSQSGSAALGTKILLNASDVFNFSDNDTIYVIGSKGDVVDIDNAAGTNTGTTTWVQGADVTLVTGGVTFATWTGTFSDAGGSHQVTLLVDKDVTVA